MRRFIAWTMTLAAGASSLSIAAEQAPKPQPAPRPGTQAPAPRPTAAPAPKATVAPVAPLDPAARKVKLAADARAREEMNLLLSEWEKQSAKIKSLHVVFDRIDRSLKWGDQLYQGQAILKSPDLARLDFTKVVADADGKPKFKLDAKGQQVLVVEPAPFQQIVCTGKEVLQFEADEKAIYIYPLDKEARQKALQQGPLPFLFNMKAAEARQRYGMTLLPDEKRPDEYLIGIVPREEIDKKNFKQAFVWLNKQSFLPSRLLLYPEGEKDKQEFRFTSIFPNKMIDDAFFHPPTNLEGWKVNRNEDPNVATAPGRPVAAPAPKQVATQPAPRSTKRP